MSPDKPGPVAAAIAGDLHTDLTTYTAETAALVLVNDGFPDDRVAGLRAHLETLVTMNGAISGSQLQDIRWMLLGGDDTDAMTPEVAGTVAEFVTDGVQTAAGDAGEVAE